MKFINLQCLIKYRLSKIYWYLAIINIATVERMLSQITLIAKISDSIFTVVIKRM